MVATRTAVSRPRSRHRRLLATTSRSAAEGRAVGHESAMVSRPRAAAEIRKRSGEVRASISSLNAKGISSEPPRGHMMTSTSRASSDRARTAPTHRRALPLHWRARSRVDLAEGRPITRSCRGWRRRGEYDAICAESRRATLAVRIEQPPPASLLTARSHCSDPGSAAPALHDEEYHPAALHAWRRSEHVQAVAG